MRGLPWWSSGKESAFQCRDTGYLVRELRSHLPPGNKACVPQLKNFTHHNKEIVCGNEDPAQAKILKSTLVKKNIEKTSRAVKVPRALFVRKREILSYSVKVKVAQSCPTL